MTKGPNEDTNKVWPSGAARVTKPAPMVPVAPALFSMIKLPPKRSCSLGAKVRAMRSVEPPGGNGTTKDTGLSGQAMAPVTHKAAIRPVINFFIVVSF